MIQSSCCRSSSRGLRRVNPTTLSYSLPQTTKSDGDEHLEEAEIMEALNEVAVLTADNCNSGEGEEEFSRIFAIPPTQNATEMDAQRQQLTAVCETIQRQVGAVLRKLGRAVDSVNAMDGDRPRNARELLRDYERTIWPAVVEVVLNIKTLARVVRETIDSCNINEPRLDWLLNVSKFQVTMESAIGSAIGVSSELERVLQIHARGEVRGLRIKEETVAALKAVQTKSATIE
uniref:Uncharacterized protein n=1 Tax=Globodera rostochiensis TaxID=31243 RepID=A0A914HRC1_GLORO